VSLHLSVDVSCKFDVNFVCFQDKGFEVHHSQIERSTNIYATTQLYARVLERLDQVQANNAPNDVPQWALATMVMDEGFDEWNVEVKEKLQQASDSIQRFQTIPNLQVREARSLIGVRACHFPLRQLVVVNILAVMRSKLSFICALKSNVW
jgi:hypothetical protein